MNRIMLTALAAVSAAAPASAAERRFTITDFDRIQVDGPYDVTLATGRAGAATATGSNAALDRVSIEVQGRTLRIRPSSSTWGGYPGGRIEPLKIAVATHELRGAALSGPGSIAIDKARAMRFDVAVAGSGRIGIGSVEADHLTVGLMGSGRVSLGGKAKELVATVQGAGDLDARQLMAEEAKVNADTAGNIAVAVRRAADVTATGQGDTTIIGNPSCNVKGLSSGRVACGN